MVVHKTKLPDCLECCPLFSEAGDLSGALLLLVSEHL